MYAVYWSPDALVELTECWLSADARVRRAITEVTQVIDAALRSHPHQAGEAREPGRRILLAPPLGVKFRVDERGRTAYVLKVLVRITLDKNASHKLSGLSDRAEIVDENGELLGYFYPTVPKWMYEGVDSPLSQEELERREQETEWFTTDEVLAHLYRLGESEDR